MFRKSRYIDAKYSKFVSLEERASGYAHVDSRTYKDEAQNFHVYPVRLTKSKVYICCPLCGEIHWHGSENGLGHRVGHCRDNNPNIFKGYFIEKN